MCKFYELWYPEDQEKSYNFTSYITRRIVDLEIYVDLRELRYVSYIWKWLLRLKLCINKKVTKIAVSLLLAIGENSPRRILRWLTILYIENAEVTSYNPCGFNFLWLMDATLFASAFLANFAAHTVEWWAQRIILCRKTRPNPFTAITPRLIFFNNNKMSPNTRNIINII